METKRIVITGGPRCGKTTYTEFLSVLDPSVPVFATDSLIGKEWSEVSDTIAHDWLRNGEGFIIEGCRAAHGLRKFISENPGEKPCDTVFIMQHPVAEQSKGQKSFAKSVNTVLGDILDDLEELGVDIIEVNDEQDLKGLYA